jgi:hypothetical protein
MTLKQPDPAKADKRFETVYQGSRGGHFPPAPKQPAPGTSKKTGAA